MVEIELGEVRYDCECVLADVGDVYVRFGRYILRRRGTGVDVEGLVWIGR
jgi:hypothetical protein